MVVKILILNICEVDYHSNAECIIGIINVKSLVVSGKTSRFWEADSWGEVGRKIVN